MEVRIRLGSGIARHAPAPVMTLSLPGDATVGELYERLAVLHPDLAAPLQSAVAIVAGAHVPRERQLASGEEIALLAPISGGSIQ